MDKASLGSEIFKASYRTGDFLLRSGQRSPEYFDKYQFETRPRLLSEIAKRMTLMIPSDTDFLAGLEMGGIPIATALSLETGLPTLLVRKEAKTYGTCQIAEGQSYKSRKVCIIEDVVTTGGQVGLSAKALLEDGAILNKVLCVIYRGTKEGKEAAFTDNSLDLQWLFSSEELKTYV